MPASFLVHNWGHKYACHKEEEEEDIETSVSKIFFSTEQCEYSDLKLFVIGGQTLGREITSHLDIALGRHKTTKFSDGEISM